MTKSILLTILKCTAQCHVVYAVLGTITVYFRNASHPKREPHAHRYSLIPDPHPTHYCFLSHVILLKMLNGTFFFQYIFCLLLVLDF